MSIWIGLGFDVHKFSKRRKKLVLGGVRIDYPRGLEAISDGDVVLHSICDAILGAISGGDIGDYFPPTKKFKNIKSKKIAKFVLEKIKGKKILNIDITLILDKPKLSSYKKEIVGSLKKIFKTENINLKIKSKEATNFFGDEESIVCFSVVSLADA